MFMGARELNKANASMHGVATIKQSTLSIRGLCESSHSPVELNAVENQRRKTLYQLEEFGMAELQKNSTGRAL